MTDSSGIDEKAKLYFQNISESISFVFRSLLAIEARPRKLFHRRLSTLPKDIIITIDFTTDLQGYFAFFLSLKTSLEICSRLMPGIDNTFFDKDHLDILGELGNIITGNTIGKLQSIDSEIKLSAPYLSAFHKVLAAEKLFHTYSANFEIEVGQLGVLLSIEKRSQAPA